jgi:hypothetical protein
MTTLEKWFVLTGIDSESQDASDLASLTAQGERLISIAQTQLLLYTHTSVPDRITACDAYDTFTAVVAQMAAELYEKVGRYGVVSESSLGSSTTVSKGYSDLTVMLMNSLKRIGIPS